MAAAVYDFTIEKGAVFNLGFRYLDSDGAAIDISTDTIAMQIRENFASETAIDTLTTGNGRITITDGPAGAFELDWTAAQTTALTSGGVYDIELSPGGDTSATIRIVQGTITLSNEVTQV